MSHHSGKNRRRRVTGQSRSAMSTAAECAEERVLLSAAAIDGTGNNLQHPEWGSTAEDLLRLAKAEYADAVSAVGGVDRPSARVISNAVSDVGGEDVISDRMMSAMIYTWGQFVDHDMTLTKSGTTEKMSIPVPKGDTSFDPLSTGTKTIDTMRSAYDESTGTTASNPRQQMNLVTAFLDGSMVYGSDTETAASLRTFFGGKMKTSEGDLLPVGDDGMFQGGDIRVNENPGLTSLQTLFVREHNCQAAKIAAADSSLTDEQIFQKARSLVIAEIQAITYNEWLPSLLGQGSLTRYAGYNPNVNPGISNEFATAAFRFGHSLLGDDIEFMDNNGLKIREGVSLSAAFFNPDLVSENGIDSVLKYLTSDPSAEVDTRVVDGVRNFLFGPPGAGGLDLASLNIQRGRDHGLADYNDTRAAIGLKKVTSFAQITANKEMQAKLQSLYGTVDNIDLWVGGLAEDHVKGSSVGVTFQRIIADQFQRLRDGDRFWYQQQFSGRQLMDLQRTSLSDIVERNTRLTSIQQNAFVFKAAVSGIVVADFNRDGKPTRGEPAVANAQVQLINTEDGTVVASAKTDRQGKYAFEVKDGLRTGVYQVKATKADGTMIVSSGNMSITGGDDFERVDLAVPAPSTPPTPPQPPAPPRPAPPRHSSPGSSAPAVGALMANVNSSTALVVASNRTIENHGTRTQPASAAGAVKSSPSSPSAASTWAALTGSSGLGSSTTSASLRQLDALIDSVFTLLPPGLL